MDEKRGGNMASYKQLKVLAKDLVSLIGEIDKDLIELQTEKYKQAGEDLEEEKQGKTSLKT